MPKTDSVEVIFAICRASAWRRLPGFGEVQRMSGLGTPLTSWQRAEHGCSAGTSDIDLFGYGKGVVDFDTEVANRALDLLMPSSSCTARKLPVRR